MRISDWSSDVCSSDLVSFEFRGLRGRADLVPDSRFAAGPVVNARLSREDVDGPVGLLPEIDMAIEAGAYVGYRFGGDADGQGSVQLDLTVLQDVRSEEHTSELQSLMRISYAVFCLKKKKNY